MDSKKREKGFLKTLTLASLVGLGIMFLTTALVIRALGGSQKPAKAEVIEEEKEKEEKTEKSQGIIDEIDYDNKTLKVWSNKDKGYISLTLDLNSKLEDAYGLPIVSRELGLGDLVIFEYALPGKHLVYLQKDPDAWKKTVKNIKIDQEKFHYSHNILVKGLDGEKLGLEDLSPMDTLSIQGIGDTAWSINIVELPGFIKVINSPSDKGKVEVDNDLIYDLEEAQDQVPAKVGKRKIVIAVEGYKSFVEYAEIVKDEVHTIDLQYLEKEKSNLKVQVTNPGANYTIHINNEKFKKGQEIILDPGTYPIRITAEGYKTILSEIQLRKGSQSISLRLEKEKDEKEEEEKSQEKQPKKTTRPPTPSSPSSPSRPAEKKEEEKIDKDKPVQIIIETEPAKAQVFVSGVYKGETPTLTGLKPGDYNISIEKEGYSTLYTTIVIDSGKEQKSFLYELDEEESD